MLINGKVLHLRDFITKIYYAIEELRDLALIRGGKGPMRTIDDETT